MRKLRIDAPGLFHHVCNRGLARRSVFENDRDMRFFRRRLRTVVEDGGVEVLAFSVLTNHFHLLLHSVEGGLSMAVRRLEQGYVQYFNRTRDRDGPLFRDRFFSRPIKGSADLLMVVRYIDENPVVADLVPRASDYPHGSAFWYARRTGPVWLARRVIERSVCGDRPYDPAAYQAVLGQRLSATQRSLLERRMKVCPARDSLDHLLLAAPEHVRRWLADRAELADRVQPVEVLLEPGAVVRFCEQQARRLCDPWFLSVTQRTRNAWPVACSALLRFASGLTREEIAEQMGVSRDEARGLARAHRRAMQEDSEYAARLSTLLRDALHTEHAAVREQLARVQTADNLPEVSPTPFW